MLHDAIFLAILVANEPATAAADFRILPNATVIKLKDARDLGKAATLLFAPSKLMLGMAQQLASQSFANSKMPPSQ
jgi:hypothetical protein